MDINMVMDITIYIAIDIGMECRNNKRIRGSESNHLARPSVWFLQTVPSPGTQVYSTCLDLLLTFLTCLHFLLTYLTCLDLS